MPGDSPNYWKVGCSQRQPRPKWFSNGRQTDEICTTAIKVHGVWRKKKKAMAEAPDGEQKSSWATTSVFHPPAADYAILSSGRILRATPTTFIFR
jgi:hypothetical protein